MGSLCLLIGQVELVLQRCLLCLGCCLINRGTALQMYIRRCVYMYVCVCIHT